MVALPAAMRVLVTGSSGQLGSEVVRQLAAAGYDPAGLDVRPGDTTRVVADISDVCLIQDLVRGAHAVVHTASLHAPHVGVESRQRFVDVNVTGTLALLEAAVRAHVRR